MAEKVLFLPCPECEASIEIDEATKTTVCVYCASVVEVYRDEEGDLVGHVVEASTLSPEGSQAIAARLQDQAGKIRELIADKRARVDKVAREMKEEERRDISLLPSAQKRNSNILILLIVILLAVVAGNLFNRSGDQGSVMGISIFTIVVFLGVLAWVIFTYFSRGGENRASVIRFNYQQELEQLTNTTREEIAKLEERLNLTERQIERLKIS
jgi:hypothetical protein